MSDATGKDADDLPTDTEETIGDLTFSNSEYESEWEEESEPEYVTYNSSDFISKPFLSESSTLPENILDFQHSFSYECLKYFNICAADEHTVIFASGNLLHFYDVTTRNLWFRRSYHGGGIGSITRNPRQPHIAVGEKGRNPHIIIYEWPSMDIVCVLKGGSTRSFTCMNYSPDGNFLCSQGGEPDYFLTVWNWSKSQIMRQQKAYVQEILNIMFSPYLPGRLTTAGLGHIKFWKMANTFTGLKLMGSLGRFGKTEISDIIGFLPLPDEQVISGCDWGNLLLWNEGLIKLEVCGMDKTTCHQGPVVQVFLDKKELVTVGQDGIINTWYFDTIDKADPTDEDFKLEMKPYNTYEIGSGNKRSKLMCIVNQRAEDPNCTKWFAQDGNGRIWKIDLLRAGGRQPEEIFFSHAGSVADIATSPCGPYFASLGVDGRIFFYNYLTKKLLFWKQFSSAGGCLLWIPLTVDRSGCTLIAGFSDGVLRILHTSIQEEDESQHTEKPIALVQVSKPHTEAITQILLNKRGNVLVTGSTDATVFVFKVSKSGEYVHLDPIGFIILPSAVVFLSWKDEQTNLMIGTKGGDYIETTIPDKPVTYTTTSYQLIDVRFNIIKFKSVKSQIRRDILLAEIEKKKEEKLERKKEELKKMRDENPHLDIDENTFLEDSESEEDLGPLYYPEIPNAILFAIYVTEDIIWLSVGGYDAGYMYEYSLGNEDPICFTMIPDADDIEINTYLYSNDKEYLIFGMQDGKIRINRVQEDYHDLNDYWLLSMHDNDNGIIKRLCFSYDDTYLFSCGNDGNIFSYLFLPPNGQTKFVQKNVPPKPPGKDLTRDITDPKYNSIQQAKLKEVYDKKMRKANSKKESVLRVLADHQSRFSEIINRNKHLPESQMISQSDFELDSRIIEDLEEELDEHMQLMHRKLAFQVEKSTIGINKLQDIFINSLKSLVIPIYGIRNPWKVTSFRQIRLGPLFYEAKNTVAMKLEELLLKSKVQDTAVREELSDDFGLAKVKSVESFLKGVNVHSPEFQENKKLVRLLDNYFQKKSKLEKRKHEWHLHEKRKPDPNVNHPDDVAAIEIAKETIGDFNLKSSPDYSVPHHLRVTTLHKYDQLLAAREKLHLIKFNYNSKVYKMRETKLKLIHQIKEWSRELTNIQSEIEPDNVRLYSQSIPFNQELEYPESLFQLNLEDKEVNLIIFDDIAPVKSVMDPSLEVLIHSDYIPRFQGSNGHNEPSTTSLTRYLARQFKLCSLLDVETLNDLFEYDSISTPWEDEFRDMRKIRKLFEQDQIHTQIDRTIQAYDDEVKESQEQKIDVIVNSKVQELHLLSLHQELIIIKEFEATEDNLSQNVLEKTEEKSGMLAKVTQLQGKIDSRKREIDNMNEKMKQLGTAFSDAVADDRFADFLKRIYKKKYRPPKARDTDESDDESSSSSDESSSDEDMDDESIASGDLGAIKLDESICPPGCRRDLYDLTFNLRSQRYVLEQDLLEEKKQIENLKKEQEQTQKKIKSVEVKQKQYEEELLMYQREKQKRLNEIDYAVLVHLSQMQYFNDATAPFAKLQDKLLFSENTLERLFHRVGELEEETVMAKEKHKFDKQHRRRMRTDCDYMAKDIVRLKSEITECMIEKFGRKVNLDEIEQYVLRKNISLMQTVISDFRFMNDKKIALMQDYIAEKQEYLSRLICQNTEKLNILTVLEEEKNYLIKILRKQQVKVNTFSSKILEYSSDIKKLKKTITDQEISIKALKREMYAIKHNPVQTTTSEEILIQSSSAEELKDFVPTVIEAKVGHPEGSDEYLPFIREQLTKSVLMAVDHKDEDDDQLEKSEIFPSEHLRSIVEGVMEKQSRSSIKQMIEGFSIDLVDKVISESGAAETEEFMEDEFPEEPTGVKKMLSDVIKKAIP